MKISPFAESVASRLNASCGVSAVTKRRASVMKLLMLLGRNPLFREISLYVRCLFTSDQRRTTEEKSASSRARAPRSQLPKKFKNFGLSFAIGGKEISSLDRKSPRMTA